jgi:hypothetical protein
MLEFLTESWTECSHHHRAAHPCCSLHIPGHNPAGALGRLGVNVGKAYTIDLLRITLPESTQLDRRSG